MGASESLFIAQIIVLLLVGRLLGEAMQRIGQSAVMGQLLAGVLLGPSVFGAVWPEAQQALFPAGREQRAMLEAVSDLGILMLLLLTGMETDLKLVRKARRPAISVSTAGVAVPLALGVTLGFLLPDSLLPHPEQRLITALFLGTALSVASVKIVATVVREMKFIRRKVGMTLLASAIIDDTVGWTIIAITSSLALHGKFNATILLQSVLGTGLFLLLSFTLGRRFVFGLIRWTNDTFVSEVPVVTAILVVMGVMALITHLIGIHTVLGAFVAGILVGESPILTRHIDEQLRGVVTALFMPVFFFPCRPPCGLVGTQEPAALSPCPRLYRGCKHREVHRCVSGRRTGPAHSSRIARAGLWHECPRLDRSHYCHDRSVVGSDQSGPLHHDRHHGGRDNARDAANTALGTCETSVTRGGAGAPRA